jgi:hypothetical protein
MELQPPRSMKLPSPEEYAATFRPTTGVDYDWVEDYAVKACQETAANAALLDGKAERLVTFTVAATAAAIAFLSKDPMGWVALAALPAAFCALRAVGQGIRVLKPRTHYTLPDIDLAMDFAELYREQGASAAKASFAAKLHEAREAEQKVILLKSADLKSAFDWLHAAMWSLLLPLLVAAASVVLPIRP